jgi:glycosyltransferase involved in cell wall biosynthesis
VVVVPNALDEQLWLRRNESGDFIQPITSHQDTVRFIYMGTMTHAIDLTILLEPLRRIKQEYGHKITLDVVGGVNDNRMQDTGLTGIARHRLKHGMNYPAFVQWLTAHNHWDIGLIPLEVNPFNRKKSYIKYLDYAALGIPSICTRIEPYEDAIVDGENGILVTNDDESWYRAMKQLIENREQRAMIAAAAFANLTAKHVLQQRAADFCRAYKTLLST